MANLAQAGSMRSTPASWDACDVKLTAKYCRITGLPFAHQVNYHSKVMPEPCEFQVCPEATRDKMPRDEAHLKTICYHILKAGFQKYV